MKNVKQTIEAIDRYTLKLSMELADFSAKRDETGICITTGELLACANILEVIGVPKRDNKAAKVVDLIRDTFDK